MFKRKMNTRIMLTIGSVLSLFIFGLFDSLKGSTISALSRELKFGYSLGGTIVMGQYAGYFAATFLVGRMIDYFGYKMTLIFGGICMLAGVTGYAASSVFFSLLLFVFFIGMGLGTLELSGSNIITVFYPEKKGSYLNILTAIAGIGSIFSPIIVNALFVKGFSWRMVYYSGLTVLLPATIYFILIKNPLVNRSRQSGDMIQKKHAVSTSVPLFRYDFLSMYLVNFLYMAAEMGIATWLTEFYMKIGLGDAGDSTRNLSLFYIGMTSGRMIGSIFVDRLGRRNSILFGTAGALFCILTGIFGPPTFRSFAAVSGVFCSVIFPTATAVISSFPEGDCGRVQGFYFACGGLGGMFGPWIMGVVSDYCGVKWGMILSGIFLTGIFLVFLFSRNLSTSKISS